MLRQHTGAVCAVCQHQCQDMSELQQHAKEEHGLQACDICINSGRFFGQELKQRTEEEHKV